MITRAVQSTALDRPSHAPHRSVMRLLCALLLLLAAPAAAAPAGVYAASSLTEAMAAIADDYAATGRARPTLVFGASSALARQIEHGAPAGLFVSADLDWPAYLERKMLLQPA